MVTFSKYEMRFVLKIYTKKYIYNDMVNVFFALTLANRPKIHIC